MAKNIFVLTEGELIKVGTMTVLASLLFGMTGLAIMIFLQWITRQTYAADVVDKHGISHVSASRLGGAAVFVSSLCMLIIGSFSMSFDSSYGPLGIHLFGWVGALSCAALGLVEDLYNDRLSPRFRLLSKFFLFAAIIGFWPYLIPVSLGVPSLDALLALPVVGWALTVIFCVGFINAVNMADGANGLMPGILTIAFGLFYLETNSLLYANLLTACGLFTIFNVISGRLFLGDAGTYGLGAALALSGLYLNSQGVFSAAFLAVLFAYPCIDFVVSLSRRALQGRSILLPDNDHLHNRVHFQFKRLVKSKTAANSLTGCSIALLFSGVALCGYFCDWLPMDSNQWALIFVAQWLGYFGLFWLCGINRPLSQHVVQTSQ